MVALSVKKGNGTKRRRRRTEWSTQRQSKGRIRSSGSESEMKNKWAPGLKWALCLLVLSGLCFSTFFGLRSSSIDSTPFFSSPLSTCSCLFYLSTLFPLSDSQLPQRQGHSRQGTPLLRSHSLALTPSPTSPSLLSHFFLSVLDDEDCSAAAPAQMREDQNTAPLSLFRPSLCLSLAFFYVCLVVNCKFTSAFILKS